MSLKKALRNARRKTNYGLDYPKVPREEKKMTRREYEKRVA